MGLLDNLLGPDLAQGLKEFEKTPGAVLVDVRTPVNESAEPFISI